MAWFSLRRQPAAHAARAAHAIAVADLGTGLVALRLDGGRAAPPATIVVVCGATGQVRRALAGKVACGPGETAFCFHPGPYTVDLLPFAAAPEWGLRLRFVVDAANPHVEQQRFDLFLSAEVAPGDGRLSLHDLAAAMQAALQGDLAHGALDLPPCTSLEEWHAFRAGLNQLLYTRYGVTADDCVPVDLGGQVDFAQVLRARAAQAAIDEQAAIAEQAAIEAQAAAATQAEQAALAATAPDRASAPAPVPAAVQLAATTAATPTGAMLAPDTVAVAAPVMAATAHFSLAAAAPIDATATATGGGATTPVDGTAAPATERTAAATTSTSKPANRDAAGLRRLFLELPVVGRDLRVLTLPAGSAIFRQHQAVLLRLGMASLNVDTMPALAWTAPDQPLDAANQARRTGATAVAVAALDQAWSLLARLQLAGDAEWPALLDDADRICANLETGLALRRAPHGERLEPVL